MAYHETSRGNCERLSAGDQADNSQRTAAASLHLCFELTRHGDSIVGILPGLASVLQQDVALLHACLPSMALLAHLSPRSTADAIMDHILGLCSSVDSLSSGVTGNLPYLIGAGPDGLAPSANDFMLLCFSLHLCSYSFKRLSVFQQLLLAIGRIMCVIIQMLREWVAAGNLADVLCMQACCRCRW